MDPIRRLINRWGMLLTALLCVAIGVSSAALANGGTTQVVRTTSATSASGAVPTTPKASSSASGAVPTTPKASSPSTPSAKVTKTPAVFTGNPFVKRTSQDIYGNAVHFYTCASGLTSVDVPLTGKGYGLNGMTATATADTDGAGDQTKVHITLSVGKNVSVPGMIVHAYSTYNTAEVESDTALALRLTTGQSTYTLPTSAYVSDQVDGDQIPGVTVCVQA